MDFKILAIQPLKGCDKKYLKVLSPDVIYKFYNNYNISEKEITKLEDNIPLGLYDTPNNIRVNISAIVGKNGSGKSSLVELMYAIIYIASWKLGLLQKMDKLSIKEIESSKIKARIYFQKDLNFYSLCVENNKVLMKVQENVQDGFSQIDLNSEYAKKLFYTIASSYSLYSLNSRNNKWLDDIFEKNDGYQVPIVINPFREEGKIDINNEESLMMSRIVTNLLTLREDGDVIIRDIAPGRTASKLKFVLDTNKVKFKNDELGLKRIIYKHKKNIVNTIHDVFGGGRKIPIENSRIIETAQLYLCRKLYNITNRYRPFQSNEFKFIVVNKKKSIHQKEYAEFEFSEFKLRQLLNKIKSQSSHITLKFEQAVNYVYNFEIYKDFIGKFVDITKLANKLSEIADNSNNKLIKVIPPPIVSFPKNWTTKD